MIALPLSICQADVGTDRPAGWAWETSMAVRLVPGTRSER